MRGGGTGTDGCGKVEKRECRQEKNLDETGQHKIAREGGLMEGGRQPHYTTIRWKREKKQRLHQTTAASASKYPARPATQRIRPSIASSI